MTALLIGLLIVAAGAGGTWLALFRVNPARAATAGDSDETVAVLEADTSPRKGPAATPIPTADEPFAERQSGTTEAGSNLRQIGRDEAPYRRSSISSDPHVSAGRRIRSVLILAAVAIAIAATIGALASALVVLVVTVFA